MSKFRYRLYIRLYNHGNGGEETVKVAKFEERHLAEISGQALLSLENDYHTKFYDHYFIVDKSA